MSIEVTTEDLPRILDWIANRGGVAVWSNQDLRSAGSKTFTPAVALDGTPSQRPGWQFAAEPIEIITDPSQVTTYTEHLFKAFPVSLRRHGMVMKLTDGAQCKLDREMKLCVEKHGNAHFRKGVLTDKPASIGVYYVI